MPRGFDRFLNRRTAALPQDNTLGRMFTVARQSWRLSDDPRSTSPRTEIVASRRSAADAADIAREGAAGFRRRGYHTPSRAWWGADDTHFHRFVVQSPPRPATLFAAVAATALAAIAISWAAKRRPNAADD